MPHIHPHLNCAASMLLSKDECTLCKRVVSSSYLRRCLRCGKLYCIDCSMYTPEGYIICLNCARRQVSPRRFGTKYSQLSRYLLRRAMFTDRAVLPFAEIEGIIGDNLPLSASRDNEWWSNTRFTAQGRAWIDVGWNVESVDLQNRTVTIIRVAKPETKWKKKEKESKKTEFFKRPLRFPERKKPALPSKTKVALVQARARNIERQKMAGQPQQRGKFPTKSAYEKRLFKPEAKPSKASD